MNSIETIEYDLLYKVNSPADLKKLTVAQLPQYCRELRKYIIEECSKNPGHLASSLGAVELAVAIHYVYDTPDDKVVWDVGHQAYAHKIITGRRDLFPTNRKLGGISGFPRMSESEYDAFGAGHASTSISAAYGMAKAAELRGEQRKVVAVIGDGAMTGGLAFEGLNNAGEKKSTDILVILNDNEMSIDEGTGALKSYLAHVSTSRHYNRFKRKLWNIFAHVPPLLKIEWGSLQFEGHLVNCSQKFTMFNQLGTPVRATLQVTFKQYMKPSKIAEMAPNESPDTAKYRTVHQGDALWSFSSREYGQCQQWRVIAKANSIENPRLLDTGHIIKLPAIK